MPEIVLEFGDSLGLKKQTEGVLESSCRGERRGQEPRKPKKTQHIQPHTLSHTLIAHRDANSPTQRNTHVFQGSLKGNPQ